MNTRNTHTQLLIGDINIDLSNKSCPLTNEYEGCLFSHGFKSYINKYTRITQDSKSIIDHCFIKLSNKLRKQTNVTPYVLESSITDHFTTIISINFNEKLNTQRENTNKTYKRLDHARVGRAFDSIQWAVIETIQDPDEATALFINNITTVITQATTVIKMQSRNKKLKKWMTNGLLTSIRHRDKLKRNLKNNKSRQAIEEYKKYRNFINKLIKTVKHSYYYEQIRGANNNTAQIWNTVKDITNENSKKK